MSGIGLAGTSCTGKTTLASEVAKQTGIPFIASSVRNIYEMYGFSVNEPLSFDDRMMVQMKILEVAECAYEDMDSIFITDRTPMDYAAHLLAEALAINLSEAQTEQLLWYVKKCYQVTNLYFSSVVLLQPALSMVEETGRTSNRAYLEHINLIMIGLIADPNNKLYCAKHFMKKSVTNLKKRVDLIIQIASIVELKNMKQGELAGVH